MRILVRVHEVVILLMVLLFAVHPIHTEVVVYIKSRDEIMSLFFLLISFILLHKWYVKPQTLSLAGATISFFLALMSKEGVVTMLAVFPLMAWFFTDAKLKRILTGAVVMLIPAAIYILIRHFVLSDTPEIWGLSPVDNFLVLAPDWETRVATAVMLLGKYLLLLFFPHPLVNDYSYAQIPFVSLTSPGFLLSALVYSLILSVIFLRIKKKEPWVFGLIFLVISISIYSNLFFLIGTAFGERLMFVPSLGFCMAMVLLLNQILSSPGTSSFSINRKTLVSNWKLLTIIGLVIIFYSGKTITRNFEWKDNETLITSDVTKNPNSARLQHHLGNIYRDKARYEDDPPIRNKWTRKSLSAYQAALRIYPAHDDTQEQTGLAWYLVGHPDMGIFYFKMVLKKNPMRRDAWNNLGNIYAGQGDLPAALEAFQKATKIFPWFAEAWRNTGSVLGRMGRYEEAIPCFLKNLELEPDNRLTCQMLGLTYQNMGKPEEARYWFERAGAPVSGNSEIAK
jgi:Flp pilus assembly protein TadD